MKGVLYVVATPIGNLKDITYRAVKVLGEVDFIVAESRERTLKLLSHLELRKPIVTINTYSEERRARMIVQELAKGKSAALISAAGTPCISDPGRLLVQKAYEADVDVKSVPGVSAVIGAMAIAGLSTDRFIFYGFLPQKRGKKRKVLEQLMAYALPIVLYESPRRIKETVEVVAELAPERSVVIVRELTKVYEEVWRGPPGLAREQVASGEGKGEFTLIIDVE